MLKSIKLIPVIFTMLTILPALPAASATVTVTKTYTNTFGPTTNERWFESTQFVALGTKISASAGAFRLTSTAADSSVTNFLAFCLQPLEKLTLPRSYEMGSNFSAAVNNNLNILASNAWNLVKDKRSAAAFQMAAWEITTENSGTFDIGKGGFKIVSTREGSKNAAKLAQQWLGKIASANWGPTTDRFLVLNAPGTQDLLTNIAAVPVPAAGLLMLGGLGGLASMRRRKLRQG